jgi:hypothetical protein
MDSSSTSSSSFSMVTSCPLDHSSFQNRSNNNSNSLSNYEVGGFYSHSNLEEDTNTFLNNITISLNVEYNKDIDKSNVNYTKIDIHGNIKEQGLKLAIENIKKINPENYSGYYAQYLKFLKKVVGELEDQCKSEEKIEIDLKFTQKVKDNVTCEYFIKNKKINEKYFKDENILNNWEHSGLFYTLLNINEL